MNRKPTPTREKPPPHTDEARSPDRRRPPEPFEECGPSGGYGGAGTDEGEEDD